MSEAISGVSRARQRA